MSTYTDLDENCLKIIQPDSLNIELMEHQKTAVYAMRDLENKGYVDIRFRYYDNEEKDLRLGTNLGILGDKVGSGKTLIVVSLLLIAPKPIDRPVYFSSDKYITIRELECKDIEKL